MAEIFLARASSVGGVERHVVLKRVLPNRSGDTQLVRMFLDEARLAAQLQHPNIAQVHDIGRLGDSYFFTMEYVHGEDLRSVLRCLVQQRRTMPIQHALHVVAGAAAGLHHAHERTDADRRPLGIVHRDVSPSNVMVSYEGAVKLVDFGVAKATQRTSQTRTGMVKGKIAYLSPEQCQGRAIDRRSDIFSLGIVMWEALTCKRLFRRETDYQTMNAIVTEDAPPPSTLRPDIPPALDKVVATALSRDPGARFATAGEMLEVIEEAATRDGKTLSATAMGRFLRELFGERPEAWVGIEPDDQTVVTVTSQSVELDPATAVLDEATLSIHVEAELRRSVELRSNPRDEDDDEDAAPAPAAVTPPVVLDPAPSGRLRVIGVLLGVAIAIGVALGVMIVRGDDDREQAAPQHAAEPRPVASAPADASAPAPDAPAPPPAVVPAPAPAPTPTPDEQIERAFAAGNTQTVLRTCDAAGDGLSPGARASCAIAACKHQRAADARAWARGLPRAQRDKVPCLAKDRPARPTAPKKCDPSDVLCIRKPKVEP